VGLLTEQLKAAGSEDRRLQNLLRGMLEYYGNMFLIAIGNRQENSHRCWPALITIPSHSNDWERNDNYIIFNNVCL
jgi:hypothetical protein